MSESREERLRALLSKLDAEHEPTHEPARSVQLGRWQVADELRAILAMPETVGLPWVSVEERLPEADYPSGLLILNKHGRVVEAQWDGEEWLSPEELISLGEDYATHWLRLSAIPLPGSGLPDADEDDFLYATPVYRGTADHWEVRVAAPGPGRYRARLQPLEGEG